MEKHMTSLKFSAGILATVLSLGLGLGAADWYVSVHVGNKKNDGSQSAPLKSIQNAIDKAAPGDVIHVAGGEYYGRMNCGWIDLKKPLTLIGSYNDDFSARDIKSTPTCLRPKNEQFGSRPTFGTLTINTENLGPQQAVTIDGFVFDHTRANAYHATDGKPEGLAAGRLCIPPEKGNAKSPSIDKALVNAKTSGTLTISNCLFLNASNYALLVAHREGVVNVVNNVFLGSRNAAADVRSTNGKPGMVTFNFDHNTAMFSWQQKRDPDATMGFAVRANDKTITNITNNILGFNYMSGFDNTKGNDATKQIRLDNNIFFCNRVADVTATMSPNIILLKVEDEDAFSGLEDLECMESVSDNVGMSDPKLFKGVLDPDYAGAFINLTASEETDYDENSPMNQWREILGVNKRGKIKIKVSMYANPYPYDSAIKFFGVVEGRGAQAFK